jgi:hypothetical protein
VDSPRPYTPPEPCPKHPGSSVTRRGRYRTAKGHRQRYLCTPVGWTEGASREVDPEHARHVFTPVLPRAHVENDDACPHCEELRAVNRGETVIARGHQATTVQVAEALTRLAKGESYQEVGLWLQGEARPRAKSAKPKNTWWRAADIVEVFAPVVWADWLTTKAAQYASPPPGSGPKVVMVDDMPVFDNAQSRRRQAQRFAVLALGEVQFSTGSGKQRETILRLLRAFPDHSANSYTLLLDELDYVPNFVIADGGKGIELAIKALADRSGQDVRFITSTYHVRQSLRRVLLKAHNSTPNLRPGPLATEVEKFRMLADLGAWELWWDHYERLLTAQGIPKSAGPPRRKPSRTRGPATSSQHSPRSLTFRGPPVTLRSSLTVPFTRPCVGGGPGSGTCCALTLSLTYSSWVPTDTSTSAARSYGFFAPMRSR